MELSITRNLFPETNPWGVDVAKDVIPTVVVTIPAEVTLIDEVIPAEGPTINAYWPEIGVGSPPVLPIEIWFVLEIAVILW